MEFKTVTRLPPHPGNFTPLYDTSTPTRLWVFWTVLAPGANQTFVRNYPFDVFAFLCGVSFEHTLLLHCPLSALCQPLCQPKVFLRHLYLTDMADILTKARQIQSKNKNKKNKKRARLKVEFRFFFVCCQPQEKKQVTTVTL